MNFPLLDMYWITGFIEGDGCFSVYTTPQGRGVLSLVVRQADPQVLYRLKRQWAFGSVFKDALGYWTWSVRGALPLKKIMEGLNGKLVLKKRHALFQKWVEAYNDKYGTSMQVLPPAPVSLENAWLAGFADAEGSFNLLVSPRSNNGRDRLRIRFYVDQTEAQEELKSFQRTIGGTLLLRKTPGGRPSWRWMVDTWNCAHAVVSYFSQYPPRTRTLYVRWMRYQRVYKWYNEGNWEEKTPKIRHLIALNRRLKKTGLIPSVLSVGLSKVLFLKKLMI